MAAGDYPGSTFYPASGNNYTVASRPSSNPIDKIIIHVTQGSWSSAINWFANPAAGVSAHYTVRSSDGFVGQSVREKDIGYHAGNWPYNQTSIGIEHEGYVNDPKWLTDAMYRGSAKLSAYLCKKYGIPIDRSHLLGHNQVPYATHTDPGGYWDWTKYINLVKFYAGTAAPAPYAQVVDNATVGRFLATSAWGTSAYSAGKYGSSYRYISPGTTTSLASFRVKIPARGYYAVYGWWPASSGYNDRTEFRIYTASGWVPKVVSQRTNGGKWMYLGRYLMPAGDAYWVQVTNRSMGKGLVIADAVRIVASK